MLASKSKENEHNSVLFLNTSNSQLHDSSHTSLQKILNTPAGCQVSGNLICTWWTSGKPKNRLPMMCVKLLPIGFKGWPSDMKRQQPDAFLGGHPSYWLLELVWIHREYVCICVCIYIYINQPGPTTKTCNIDQYCIFASSFEILTDFPYLVCNDK